MALFLLVKYTELQVTVITSKKKTLVTWDPEKEEKHEREVLIWNETVANLTLMALGSNLRIDIKWPINRGMLVCRQTTNFLLVLVTS
jgi:hypothetical protein